jgi:hypothetical protein
LDVGDRTLRALRPPLFDNPATTGFYDERTRTCFSSDCFGAPMPTPALAAVSDVREIPAADLRAVQLLWAAVDSPWVHNVHSDRYFDSVRAVRALGPETVYSTHLPPAPGIAQPLCDMLAAAPDTNPFIGPDQQALEAMLATFEPAAG